MTTTTATGTGILTAADLLRLDGEGVRGELIRGVLCEMAPAGQRHGRYGAKLLFTLMTFVEPRRLGTVVTAETGVWLERDPDTVRAPDVAFTSAARMPLGEDLDGYAEVVPDLVVEVRSPTDSARELHDKAQMWLRHGVRLVWVVHPATRTVDVYREDGPALTLGDAASLDGGDVLPGFACPVSAIFDP